MPEVNNIKNLRVLPIGWDQVTSEMAERAKVTANLARALSTLLGRSGKVDTIEFRIKTALGEAEPSLNIRSLARRVANTDSSSEPALKDILKQAITDSNAVVEAFDIKERRVFAQVLTKASADIIASLPDTAELRQILELGTSGYNYREVPVEITTVESLLKFLNEKFTKRSYIRRVKPEDVAKPKKVEKKPSKKIEVVSTLPGISYSIDGKPAKPISKLNRMGGISEVTLTKALKKCLNSENGVVDITKERKMFVNLIKRNFVTTFKGEKVNAVIMFGGKSFKITNLPKDAFGFRIKLV